MISSSFTLLALLGQPHISASAHPAVTPGPARPAIHLPDYAQVTDDLFIGNRLLLGSMSMAEVKRRHIRTIRKKTTAARWTSWETEQFDAQGHTVYRRSWTQEPNQPGSGYSQFFACEYAPDGKLTAVSALEDSLGRHVRQRFTYSYTRRGQLRRAGHYRLTYYLNGLLQSVTSGSTEHYFYNADGQPIRIEFGTEPGIVACGNGTTEWRGEYDAGHRLSRETHIGVHGHTYQLFYDQAGQLIRRTSADGGWNYECRYTYQDGLLARTEEKFNGREFGEPQVTTTTYAYERY